MKTLEDGFGYTLDVANGRPILGTRAFTDNIIGNLDQFPKGWTAREHQPLEVPPAPKSVTVTPAKSVEVVGMDVFTEFDDTPEVVGALLEKAASTTRFNLKMISNRGTQVYPDNGNLTDCVDHWRCRFMIDSPENDLPLEEVSKLLTRIEQNGMRWMHTEKLNRFDGEDAFTKAQGEN